MVLINLIRNAFVIKVICIALACNLVNVSVDPVDMAPSSLPEDLTINDIESLLELILEEIAGFNDFFGESDEDDSEITIVHVSFILPQIDFVLKVNKMTFETKHPSIYGSEAILSPSQSIITPPPRATLSNIVGCASWF